MIAYYNLDILSKQIKHYPDAVLCLFIQYSSVLLAILANILLVASSSFQEMNSSRISYHLIKTNIMSLTFLWFVGFPSFSPCSFMTLNTAGLVNDAKIKWLPF